VEERYFIFERSKPWPFCYADHYPILRCDCSQKAAEKLSLQLHFDGIIVHGQPHFKRNLNISLLKHFPKLEKIRDSLTEGKPIARHRDMLGIKES
jgi:hypothetical protein